MKCRFVAETAPPGQAWYEAAESVGLMRVARAAGERVLRVREDQLQAALDRAAAEFFDPLRPRTPPIPDSLLPSSSISRRRFSRRT